PKDLRAFCKLLRTEGVDAGIPEAAETVNLQRTDSFFQKIQSSLWVLKGKKLCLLGLSHKPNTNDIRASPAIKLARRLSTAGARIAAFDPQALSDARASFPEFNYRPDPYVAADRADALLLLTEWEEFRRLDWQRIRNQMARPLILDGRNFLSPSQMKSLGFEYISVGRP
ncbi:MAG: UDP binding domain-containing protein, partial [Candidatus Acidiferrum sp.]